MSTSCHLGNVEFIVNQTSRFVQKWVFLIILNLFNRSTLRQKASFFWRTDWFLATSDNNRARAPVKKTAASARPVSSPAAAVIHSILWAPGDPPCSLGSSRHCSQTTISATKSTSLQIFSLGVRFVFWLLREKTENKPSSEDFFYIPPFNRAFVFEHLSVTAYHRESGVLSAVILWYKGAVEALTRGIWHWGF